MHTANPGSFKDPAGRVYHCGGRVLRGLTAPGAEIFAAAEKQEFYARWTREGKIIGAVRAGNSDADARALAGEGWDAVLEHERIPFVSYPYEWPFAMLKDAALLHLELLETAVKNGWTFKDATPYNIQWFGARPVFVDITSPQPRTAGEPWAGYRQFCMNFLFPLMLKAHLNIDYAPLLRAELDGVPAGEILRYFSGRHIWKKGVLPHVVFPALAEEAAKRKQNGAAPKTPRQPDAVVLGLIRGLQNTVQKLSRPAVRTAWSDYGRTHSYGGPDVAAKEDFVRRAAAARRRNLVWDLGCNAGAYSKICAEHSGYTVAVDGDSAAVERLYLEQKGGGNILPLTMNLANMSPGQGWAGQERAAFAGRGRPGLILCLALVHHMRISSNIPLPLFLDWLRGFDADVVVEFVGREDEMTQALLRGKTEKYEDYGLPQFESALGGRFAVEETALLKNGGRKLYFARPR